jgi:hypothetical protein
MAHHCRAARNQSRPRLGSEDSLVDPIHRQLAVGNPSVGVSGAHYTVVVARRFSVQGTSNMNNDFSGVSGGNPKVAALVE